MLLEEATRKQQMFLNHVKSTIFRPNQSRNIVQSKMIKTSYQIAKGSASSSSRKPSKQTSGKTKHPSSSKSAKQLKRDRKARVGAKDVSKKGSKQEAASDKKGVAKEKSKVKAGGKSSALIKNEAVKAPLASPVRPSSKALSSSEIDRSSLASIDSVLSKYQDLIDKERVAVLARKLATEAVIGEAVMKRCTPRGRSYYPALPVDSLYTIKQVLLNNFPQFWDKPDEFKLVWAKAIRDIERTCSSLRMGSQPKSQNLRTSAPPAEDVAVSHTEDPIEPSTHPFLTGAHGPAVVPILNSKSPLPSSEIPKSKLTSVEKFLTLHVIPVKEGKYEVTQLLHKLAFEVVFGEEVLKRCTLFGGRPGLHGLPTAEFNMLKQLLLNCLPSFWDRMDEFEHVWKRSCLDRLSRMCSKLRRDSQEDR
jgi:hypothetical protein